jgi:hypothetical protein
VKAEDSASGLVEAASAADAAVQAIEVARIPERRCNQL